MSSFSRWKWAVSGVDGFVLGDGGHTSSNWLLGALVVGTRSDGDDGGADNIGLSSNCSQRS